MGNLEQDMGKGMCEAALRMHTLFPPPVCVREAEQGSRNISGRRDYEIVMQRGPDMVAIFKVAGVSRSHGRHSPETQSACLCY